MGWNESGNGKNPWGDGRGKQQPPDLDEVVRNLQNRLSGLFGGRRRRGGKSGNGGINLGFILLGAVALWAAWGIYKIDAPERGVVTRFGVYIGDTGPGLHWRIPLVDIVEKVNVSSIREYPYTNVPMLTADENIVTISTTVQYQRRNPVDYLFNVLDPDITLQQAAQSAIREIVGKNDAETVLELDRIGLVDRTKELLQNILDEYGTGIVVIGVQLTDATPPPQVKTAVDDATKAREDKERLILEAEGYSNDLVPRARGQAARQLQEAEAYKARVVADAEGEASRFTQLLTEYEKAPDVTRQRLYLETMEKVLRDSSKVLMDTEGSGNLVYLPVDKLLEQRTRRQGSDAAFTAPSGGSNPSDAGSANREAADSSRPRR